MCIAVSGRLIEKWENSGKVEIRGNVIDVALGIVDADVGDYVLVHAGCAIAKVTSAEKRRTGCAAAGDRPMIDIRACEQAIRGYDGPPARLMEVCGTHTHSIFEHGIRTLLPPTVTLISGPGCPVCVTPSGYIDRASTLSLRDGWALCTFGDMMRVPGEAGTLLDAKASGGDVRLMYSPMDVLRWASAEPATTFAIAAVGFETTLPVYALLMQRAAGPSIFTMCGY